MCWVFTAACRLSRVASNLGHSRYSARASCFGDFPCCMGSRCARSVVWVHRLSCPSARGIVPKQGFKLNLLRWQVDSSPLDYQKSPSLLLFIQFSYTEHFNIYRKVNDWASLIAQLVKIHLQCRRPQFNSWVGNISWRRDSLSSPVFLDFPCGSAGKESSCIAGDLGLIPGLGRSPGEGKGYPLQYSDLENSMDCMVHGVTKSQTRLNESFSIPFYPVFLYWAFQYIQKS